MNKRFLLAFLFLLVVLSLNEVYALTPKNMGCEDPVTLVDGNVSVRCLEIKQQYNMTRPRIDVNFKDNVVVTENYVVRLGDLSSNISGIDYYVDSGFTKFGVSYISEENMYVPNQILADGIYLFRIKGLNPPYLLLDIVVIFEINASQMNFWVTNPKAHNVPKPDFAVSNTNNFRLNIETERDTAECKFSTSMVNLDIDELFESFMSNNFSKTNDTNFYIDINFNNYVNNLIVNPVFDFRKIEVICKESTSSDVPGRYSYKQIYFTVLTQPPTIAVSSNPSTVVSFTAPNSSLNILTNQAAVCTINTPAPNLGFKPSTVNPSGTIFNSFYNYTKNFTSSVIFSYAPSPHNFNFEIICTNLANLSRTVNHAIKVDYTDQVVFEFISPKGFFNSRTIVVNGSLPQDLENCEFTFNSGSWNPVYKLEKKGMLNNGRINYVGSASTSLPDGNHEVFVRCLQMSGVYSSKFLLDTMAPSSTEIISPSYTCSFNNINLKLKATDSVNGSGISHYEYEIGYSGNISTNAYNRSGSSGGTLNVNMPGLSLIEGQTLKLKVRAVDKAGNKGTEASKDLVVSSNNLTVCDLTPPSISLNYTQDLESKAFTVRVVCADTLSGCQDNFWYSVHQDVNQNCSFGQSSPLSSSVFVATTSKFCAQVKDKNNNQANLSQVLVASYPAHCSNGIKDSTETDVDCGGSCAPCALNKTCFINVDCTSRFCDSGKCATPSCNDGVKNGFETGIDCGGSACAGCSVGEYCNSDLDCSDKNCVNNICSESSCDNAKIDGEETDVDCGGLDCSVCLLGKRCLVDNDCLSGVCENSVCKAERTEFAQTESKSKINVVGLILLILGLLFVIGGVVLLILEKEKKKQNVGSQNDAEMMAAMSHIPKVVSPEQRGVPLSKEEIERRRRTWEKSARDKQDKRKSLLGQFDTEQEEPKFEEKSKPEPEVKVEEKPAKPKVVKKESDEFINLEDLKKEKDVFEKLKGVSGIKDDEPVKAKPKTKKVVTKNSSKPVKKVKKVVRKPKEFEEDEVFEKLKKISKKN